LLDTKTVRIGTWDFHVIQLEDKDIYAEYVKKTRYPANLWSSNFAYLWADSQSSKRTILWRIIDGLLVTFAYSYKKTLYLFCLPFGDSTPEKLIDVLLTALNYCLEWNYFNKDAAVVRMINENQLEFLEKDERFFQYFRKTVWSGIERHYDLKLVSELKGKDFENIRNRINKFRRENPDAQISHYQKEDYEELLKLDEKWRNTSGRKYPNIFDGVYYKELLKHHDELEQTTLIMRKGRRIIGMISGGFLHTGQTWGSVVKFEDHIPGLSETLTVEFCRLLRRMFPEAKYINVGSDLGSGGLRDFKLKFRPVLNLKRYQLYLR